MIRTLTKEQEARLPEFRDRWLKVGLCIEPIDRAKGIRDVQAIQEKLLKRKKTPVVFLNGPFDAWIATLLFFRDWSQVESQVRSQVESQVRSQVESQVWSQVRSQVESQVRSQVWSQVWSQVDSQVWSQVESQVRSQVESQVWSQVGNQKLPDFIWPYAGGQFWASWFAYFDTMESLGLQFTELYHVWREMAFLGPIWPIENICIVSERPSIIHMRNGLLHKDEAPAVEYRDGTKVFSLNGIRIPAEHVLTPAEKIDPKTILLERNAEIRRELLRKVGMERFIAVAKNKTLDRQGDYELLSIELSPEIPDARYLKMINPSIGVFHVEGVHPECKTVEHAINWRASQKLEVEWKPEVLT